MDENNILQTIRIETEPTYRPRWSEYYNHEKPEANRFRNLLTVNLGVFTAEQRQFILQVTQHQDPVTLLLERNPHYPPKLEPSDAQGWLNFFQAYAARQTAWLQEQQENRDLIDELSALSNEELLPHSEALTPYLGWRLEPEYAERARAVVARFREYLLERMEVITVQNQQWIHQHGSPALQAAVAGLPEDALMVDFWQHLWEANELFLRHSRMAPQSLMHWFLYEYVKATFPGAYFQDLNNQYEAPPSAPAHLWEKARDLGGALYLYEDEGDIVFPEGFEADQAVFAGPMYVAVVPWSHQHLVYPLEAAAVAST